MPRKLVAVAPRTARLIPYDERAITSDEIRIKVGYASPKHGSELADFRNESPHLDHQYDAKWRTFLPKPSPTSSARDFEEFPLGNQWVGKVVEVGTNVQDYAEGDMLCGYGGIAEYHILTPAAERRLRRMPDGMPWQNALCFDPAQFAFGAIRDSHLRLGDRVAVFGLGAIGQMAVLLARLAGAGYIAAIDPIAMRRDTALASGADDSFDPGSEDVGLELKRRTDKKGVDIVIETSAHQAALQQALRGLAYGGTIAYAGWARPFPGGLDFGREAHFNNATLIFSRAVSEPNRDEPRWDRGRVENACWDILQRDAVHCERMIHPIVPFEECAAGYSEYVDRSPEKSIKMGVRFT